MANSLFPASVRINYTSAFGAHSMTLPTVPILDGPGGGAGNQFQLRGAALPVEIAGAVNDFVQTIKQLAGTDITFIDWTAFKYATPTSRGLPIESGSLNILGIAGITTWRKAVQQTWTWRTDEFGLFKLVFLDFASGNSFDKVVSPAGDARYVAINAYVTAPVTFLAGRDGGRPSTFLQVATTLNEKLRRSYRMN